MAKIREVAERAGVSLTTVSNVINHRDRVSPALRAKVEAAIAELDYQPNATAQSLRTGRTRVVAIMIPDICNPFFTELVRALQNDLGNEDYDVTIFNTDVPGGHAADHGHDYLRQVRRKRIGGLIVADAALHGIQDELIGIPIPTVFIGNLANGAVDSVDVDNFDAAYRMGTYLTDKGHQRIAHITGPEFLNMSRIRRAGFEQALADAGRPMVDDLRFEGSFLGPSGHAAVDWLLSRHGGNLPSAIFFANSLMAIGGLAALADRGIRVPEDIAVATFDLNMNMEDVRPRLTTIGLPAEAIAGHALKLLNSRMAKEYLGPPRKVVLKGRLEIHTTS